MADAHMDSARSRKVLMGTCGWSDHTLMRCGRFYPASVRSAEDRLQHYSRHFPCVEVDTSTYAIPSPVAVGKWVNAAIPGFLFHFKAFGLFCSKAGDVKSLPYKIKNQLTIDEQQVKLYDLPDNLRDELWDIFNSALQPAYQAGRLGVVVFQFHLSFKPSEENRVHVLWCRKNLDSRYPMAVEFRSREWFVGEQASKTQSWLAYNNLVLIAADELRHETFQRDREQTGLPTGQQRVVLPVGWPSYHSDFLYVRVHRREGTQRVLSDEELQGWEARLGLQLPPGFKGPIYFMWGTDWEDQPLINAKRLTERLSKELVFDWKSIQKPNNRIQSMFMAVSKVQPSSNPAESIERVEDPSDLQQTSGLRENSRVSEFEDKSTLMGEEQRMNCPASYQYSSEPQSDSIEPLSSVELSPSPIPIPVIDSIVPHTSQLEDTKKPEDAPSKKRVALSNSPPQIDGSDVSPYGKSVPGKRSEFSSVNGLTKKGGPAKKLRTSSNVTPTITSFFKRAVPKDS